MLFFVCILSLYYIVWFCTAGSMNCVVVSRGKKILPKTILQQRGEEGNGGDKIWRKKPKTYICHNLYTYYYYYYTDGCKICDAFINTYIIRYYYYYVLMFYFIHAWRWKLEAGCNFKKRKKQCYVVQCVSQKYWQLFWWSIETYAYYNEMI